MPILSIFRFLFQQVLVNFSMASGKGQIISKGLFGVLEFSNYQTSEFVGVVKTNSFVCFLGEVRGHSITTWTR